MANNDPSGTLPIFRLGEPRMTAGIVRQLTDGPEPRLPLPAAEFIEQMLFEVGRVRRQDANEDPERSQAALRRTGPTGVLRTQRQPGASDARRSSAGDRTRIHGEGDCRPRQYGARFSL